MKDIKTFIILFFIINFSFMHDLNQEFNQPFQKGMFSIGGNSYIYSVNYKDDTNFDDTTILMTDIDTEYFFNPKFSLGLSMNNSFYFVEGGEDFQNYLIGLSPIYYFHKKNYVKLTLLYSIRDNTYTNDYTRNSFSGRIGHLFPLNNNYYLNLGLLYKEDRINSSYSGPHEHLSSRIWTVSVGFKYFF